MSDSRLVGLVQKLLDVLRPGGAETPRAVFQLRFFLSAAVLGLVIAAPAGIMAAIAGQYISSAVITIFIAVLAIHLVAARLGARATGLMWSLLATVTGFLVIGSTATREIDPSQMAWLILIPLAARAFTAPRVEDSEPPPTGPVVWTAAGVSVAASVLIVVLHVTGLTFNQPMMPDPPWYAAANYVLFMFSALGLVYLYDISASMTTAELHRVRELLAICAWCRKINAGDDWISLEQFTTERTHSELSHGICPTCSAAEMTRIKGKKIVTGDRNPE